VEEFFQALGVFGAGLLVVIGAVAGWIAARFSGGNVVLYVVLGVVGALAAPFVLALLGVGIAVGATLLGILLIGLVGAVILLAIVRAVRR
jgi:uncharacterized membrane protein YeaQ/YmgE (transglycosylase-associated protein family)